MSNDTRLEEMLAHLSRQVEELSDVVARQDREIATLTRRVEMLMHREAERESEMGGTVPLANGHSPGPGLRVGTAPRRASSRLLSPAVSTRRG